MKNDLCSKRNKNEKRSTKMSHERCEDFCISNRDFAGLLLSKKVGMGFNAGE